MTKAWEYILLVVLAALMSNCEEAQILIPVGFYSAFVGGASATVTVEALKKSCDAKTSRDEVCKCWAEKLSRLPTPAKCWGDGKGGYINPP